MSKATVAVLRVKPTTVLDDIERLVALAQLPAALDAGADTLIKSEIGWHLPLPGASTTPWQIEGTVRSLRSEHFNRIACVVRRGAVLSPSLTRDRHCHSSVCERLDVPMLDKAKAADLRWVDYRPKCELTTLPKLFPKGIQVPDYFFGKNIVHLPVLRSDASTTVAGAVASTLSGLLRHQPRHIPSWVHGALVDGLRLQREIHAGVGAVVDGTTAGNGPGPHRLVPLVKNVVLASTDLVALDAVIAKLMGFDPLSIEYVARADDAGLGVGDPRDIELVGDDLSKESWGFYVGDGGAARRLGDLLRHRPLHLLDRALARSAVAQPLEVASAAYFDVVRWWRGPRQSFEEWKTATSWGQLFSDYAAGSTRPADGG